MKEKHQRKGVIFSVFGSRKKEEDALLASELASVKAELASVREELSRLKKEKEDAVQHPSDEQNLAERIEVTQRQFLANVSHEIRTPLNSIIGYGELILSHKELPKDVTQDALRLMDAASTLLQLLNNLLDISKLQSGTFVIREERYDLPRLLSEMKSYMFQRLHDRPVTFLLQCEPSVPDWLYGDAVLLKQILMNLLSNAVKYTEKGIIALHVSYQSGVLQLSVKDTGIGIPEKDFERVFRKFERLDEHISHSIEGVGLGLSLVKEMTERLGGTVSLTSTRGEGSTFTVSIPQKVSERGEYSMEEDEEFSASDRSVLLVDDNPMNLNIIKRLLQHFDVMVDTATSGEECLAIVKEKQYDLVLLDHMMPNMDGEETLNQLRQTEFADLPVVALTANAMKGMREFFLDKGFDDYIAKPVTLDTLRPLLNKWLGTKMSEKPAATTFSEETQEIPEILANCEAIDVSLALEYTGGHTMLLSAIRMFVDALEERINHMRVSLEEGDIAAYRIEVHTLKSAFHTIGVVEMAEQAAYLENAAKDDDVDTLHYFTEEFLTLCEEYRKLLSPIANYERDRSASPAAQENEPATATIDTVSLRQELVILRQLIRGYDLDSADAWVVKMRQAEIPSSWKPQLNAIFQGIRQVDYEKTEEEIEKMLHGIEHSGGR